MWWFQTFAPSNLKFINYRHYRWGPVLVEARICLTQKNRTVPDLCWAWPDRIHQLRQVSNRLSWFLFVPEAVVRAKGLNMIKLQRLGTEAECKTAAWRVITGYYRILLIQVPLPKDATLEELQIPEAWGPDSCKKKSIGLIWLNFTHAGTIQHGNILKHTWTQVDVHQTWSLPWLSIGVFICREGETDSKRKFCWAKRRNLPEQRALCLGR